MIALSRPSHALLFPLPSGLGYVVLIVGGVSKIYELDVVYDPKIGRPGWKFIEGREVDAYMSMLIYSGPRGAWTHETS